MFITAVVSFNNIIVINIIFIFRGSGASKNANSDDQEMKTKLVDKEGGPNQPEP